MHSGLSQSLNMCQVQIQQHSGLLSMWETPTSQLVGMAGLSIAPGQTILHPFSSLPRHSLGPSFLRRLFLILSAQSSVAAGPRLRCVLHLRCIRISGTHSVKLIGKPCVSDPKNTEQKQKNGERSGFLPPSLRVDLKKISVQLSSQG